MGKRVELSFLSGDFTQGFPTTLRIINDEDGQVIAVNEGKLPPNSQILEQFEIWRQGYLFKLDEIGNNSQTDNTRAKGKRKQKSSDYQNNEQLLEDSLKNWLNCSSSWQSITQTLYRYLTPDEDIRVIIQTNNPELRKIPWLIWFDEHFSRVEVAISPLASRKIATEIVYQTRVRILAILGNNEGINIELDREILESLRRKKAKIEVLEQPTRQELVDKLWDDKGWHIFFFAGHSGTDKEGNIAKFELSREESISIDELKKSFQKAIEKGLQFAIFNSCDGLGLGEQLADLQLPQSVVMREAIPDRIAPQFLQNFLTAFSSGQSFYNAVREARGQLEGWENQYKGIGWLPIICQNSTVIPLTWEQLRKGDEREVKVPELSREEWRNRQALLKQVREEVQARLRQSLHNQVLMSLPKEAQANQVQRPWDISVQVNHQSEYQLASDEDIVDVFEMEEVGKKLLILGAPGCGKTTTLLQLGEKLLENAEDDVNEEIPIILDLASWQPIKKGNFWEKKLEDPTIYEWLITQLNKKYGVSKELGKKWLKERYLIPLLDGLDELQSERQEKCVKAINDFLGSEFRPSALVVCSRKEEYELYQSQLNLNSSVCLQFLEKQEVKRYLEKVQLNDLWIDIKGSEMILSLIQTPLFLSMMTLAYKQISIDEWKSCNTEDKCRDYLLGVYIVEMFRRKINNPIFNKINKKYCDNFKYLSSLSGLGFIAQMDSYLAIEEIINILPTFNSKYKKIFYGLTITIILLISSLLGVITGFIFPSQVVMTLSISPFLIILFFDFLFIYYIISYIEGEDIFITSTKSDFVFASVFTISSVVMQIVIIFVFWRLHISLQILTGYIFTGITIFLTILFSRGDNQDKYLLIDNINVNFNKLRISVFIVIGVLIAVILLCIFLSGLVSTSRWYDRSPFHNDLLFTAIFSAHLIISLGLIMWSDKYEKEVKYIALTGLLLLVLPYVLLIFICLLSGLFRLQELLQMNFVRYLLVMIVTLGLVGGFIYSISENVLKINSNQRIKPNQGIWKAVRNSIIFFLGGSLLFGSLVTILFGLKTGIGVGLLFGLVFGLIPSCACIEHFALRLVLWQAGYLPWNLAKFLDYCTERRILQRVGGRYRFIHRLLQEHFANMDINQLKTQLENTQ